jgi:hypothetical protein
MFKKWLKRLAWVFVAAFVAIQFVPVDRSNPVVNAQQALSAPPAVDAVLRQSCYDCHSSETRWPFYAYVAPVSWLVADDVKKGRAKMDFSIWASYKPLDQADFLRQIKDAVTEGWMPLSNYLLIHRDAKLTPEQVKTVAAWAGATAHKLDPLGADDDAPSTPPQPGNS